MVEPVLGAFYALPKVTLYPVVLLLFGLGGAAKVAFGVMHGLIPIGLVTMAAVLEVRPVLLRTGRAMRLGAGADGGADRAAGGVAGGAGGRADRGAAGFAGGADRGDVREPAGAGVGGDAGDGGGRRGDAAGGGGAVERGGVGGELGAGADGAGCGGVRRWVLALVVAGVVAAQLDGGAAAQTARDREELDAVLQSDAASVCRRRPTVDCLVDVAVAAAPHTARPWLVARGLAGAGRFGEAFAASATDPDRGTDEPLEIAVLQVEETARARPEVAADLSGIERLAARAANPDQALGIYFYMAGAELLGEGYRGYTLDSAIVSARGRRVLPPVPVPRATVEAILARFAAGAGKLVRAEALEGAGGPGGRRAAGGGDGGGQASRTGDGSRAVGGSRGCGAGSCDRGRAGAAAGERVPRSRGVDAGLWRRSGGDRGGARAGGGAFNRGGCVGV